MGWRKKPIALRFRILQCDQNVKLSSKMSRGVWKKRTGVSGLGESVDFDEEDENAADDGRVDGTEQERRVRRLECYEWQNAASTQLDDEVLSSSAAAADNRRKAQQHKVRLHFN